MRGKRLLGTLAAVATAASLCLWTAPAVDAHERAAAADCAAKTAAQDARVANLEQQAVYVERNVATKYGPADRYHLSMKPFKENPDGSVVVPTHAGGNHASAEAFTTPYKYGGLDFFWAMDDSILHWLSDPCSGPDEYAYEFIGRCFVQGSSTPQPTPCNWNVQAALKTKHGGTDDWDPIEGYSDFDILNDVACGGQGSRRSIVDNFETLIAAWSRSQVRFINAGNHLTIHRRHTSKYMTAFAFGTMHDVFDAECAPVFCADTGTPSPILADRMCV